MDALELAVLCGLNRDKVMDLSMNYFGLTPSSTQVMAVILIELSQKIKSLESYRDNKESKE
jgi:hypothetical protein